MIRRVKSGGPANSPGHCYWVVQQRVHGQTKWESPSGMYHTVGSTRIEAEVDNIVAAAQSTAPNQPITITRVFVPHNQ